MASWVQEAEVACRLAENSAANVSYLDCSSGADLTRLSDFVRPLLRGRVTSDPRFYLASITKAWRPRVIVVSRAGAIIGVVCAKERKIFGVPTGIVHIDTTVNSILADGSIHAESVFEKAIDRLLASPGVRGLRLFVPPGGFEQRVIQRIGGSSSLEKCYQKVDYHVLLRVPPSFERFLDMLGSQTRRNFRYYRRRFEGAGGEYVAEMTFSEFKAAAFQLVSKDVVGANSDGLNRCLRMLSTVERPLLAGLRRNGEWVSILGGWYEPDRATVFLQLNDDRACHRDSLCIVLRSYVIEGLVGQNIGGLLFWAGVGLPLSRYTEPIPTVLACVDTPGIWWRACRRMVRRLNGRLPRPIRDVAAWIAPAGIRNAASNAA